ncbi:hypothetical protein JCM1393_25170 [Clostridium carnis]
MQSKGNQTNVGRLKEIRKGVLEKLMKKILIINSNSIQIEKAKKNGILEKLYKIFK